DLRLYETYLTTFPNGIYAAVARQEIERLKAGTAAPQQVALADPTRTTTDPKAIVPTGPVLTPTAPVASGDPAVVPSPNAAAAPTPVPDFVITDAMKAEAGTKETEAAVGMNRTTRREVQTRLNLVEANVGGADGIFGPRTREGIAFWQGTHGMPETGFLTTAQVTALQGQTKVQYAEHVAAAQKAAKSRSRAAKKKSATRRATASRKKATKRRASTRRATKTRRVTKQRVVRRKNRSNRRHRHNPAASAAAGAFAGAVVGSIIGGAIRY
ncbi:MAG: peptidoglycan-binding protein, partial [Pseudomonadota bacterium]